MEKYFFILEPSILTNTLGNFELHPFQPSITFHIETSHLLCSAKKMTGFCMKDKTGLKELMKFIL